MAYGKSKVRRVQKQLVEQIGACLDVHPHELRPDSTEIPECSTLYEDIDCLITVPHQSIKCQPKVQNTTKSKSVKNNNKR